MKKRINNPLELRRREFGATQKQVATFLGVTQSQYSRIEKGETLNDKYVPLLAKFFECKETELWTGEYLDKIEDNFLSDQNFSCGYTYHEKRPDHLYLEIKGWFPYEEALEAERILSESLNKMRKK